MAVDYGLLQGAHLLGNPFHYRDARTSIGVTAVHAHVSAEELYRRNGLQHLPFNTLFQLAASAAAGALEMADRVLLIPDLLGYWATGVQGRRTHECIHHRARAVGGNTWDLQLLASLALRAQLLPPIVQPGSHLGPVTADMANEYGVRGTVEFTTVGSHDTASAVVGHSTAR